MPKRQLNSMWDECSLGSGTECLLKTIHSPSFVEAMPYNVTVLWLIHWMLCEHESSRQRTALCVRPYANLSVCINYSFAASNGKESEL